ncbi:MAG: radical SAM protein [Candidatus Heimdallarchaeota archaeon]|nr:radical SAM protein [Candidatus Heimdallarchaeota archaeon]
MRVRASIGTAAAIGLERIRVLVEPTTAYLMLHSESHCESNCMFCPQARESIANTNQLSRVLWPTYDISEIISNLLEKKTGIKRICIQTVKFDNSTEELFEIIEMISKTKLSIPITVCSYPMTKNEFLKLKELGVSRVGISFDCATPKIFEKIKGKERKSDLSWNLLEQSLKSAIEVFGNRFVSTHLIIGLGETEKEAVKFIQHFNNQKITIGLFAFTPIKNTEMEEYKQPPIDSYRRIQLARYLIIKKLSSFEKMIFKEKEERITDFGINKEKIKKIIFSGKPFETTGCPHCNRPFYNESPGSELYNYPKDLTQEEISKLRSHFLDLIE